MEHGTIVKAGARQNRLLIMDGHAYAYRAFYAIRSLSSPTGEPTNAIYGFIRMLAKARERVQPSHLIVIWDGGLAEERMALHPEYKSHRPEMPGDLAKQLDQIVTYLRAANVCSFLKESCEADDCIASVAREAVKAGWEVVIASSDKDFMQLITPQVKMLNPNDKSETLFGIEEVRRKTGVEPTQIVDWLSLVGDSVDNIPGVSGVGPKTAADLLRQFGCVEELYRRLAEVGSDRLRSNLAAAAAAVKRNQDLVRLKDETVCSVALEDLAPKPEDFEALRSLYGQWGFKTLRRELEEGQAKADLFNRKDEEGCNAASLVGRE